VQAFYGKTPFRDKGKLELPGKGVPKLELGNKNSDSFPNWSLGTRTPTRSQTGAWGQELRLVLKLQFGNALLLEAPASRHLDGLTMRTRYKAHNKGKEYIYFVTSTTVQWMPLFTHQDHFDILVSSLEFCRKEKGMKLYAFVIMENHIHLVGSSPDLSRTMQSFKGFTAKKLIESMSRKGMDWMLNQFSFYKAKHKKESDYQIWQEGYHPEEILSPNMFRQKVEYLHHNPVRRGYVRRAEHWRYSSAGQILVGEKGVLELDPVPVL